MTVDGERLVLGSPRFGAEVAGSDDVARWRSLLERFGPQDAVAHVQGDFAVALRLSDGSVFMAVDRFAVQTLCYTVEDGRISFARRADALTPKHPALEPQALFEYLYYHVIPSPDTAFRDVRRLPPGHYAVFTDGELTVAPYWIPAFKPIERPSFSDLQAEFKALLRQAVTRQLDGSEPACFLSGGTDSSTIVGMTREVLGRSPATYSIGFEAEGYDEMHFARLVARRFGCAHREYYVTPDDLVRDIPRIAASFDQPFGNSSALPAHHCALQARSDGVTRLLAGDGGDELFGGNSRYATQRIFGWYQSVPGAIRGVLEPIFRLDAVSRMPLLGKGSGYIRQATTPLPDRAQTFNLLRRLGYSRVLTPEFLAVVNDALVLEQQRDVWTRAQCDSELDRQLAFDWRYTLSESDLPKVTGAAELAGVSVGYPMLDDDLVAFSTRLPTRYKLKGMRLRWFFKEALRGFLPDETIAKKKQGFGLPFGVWTVRHEGLHRLAEEAMTSLAQRRLVNAAFVRELLDTHLPSHPHYFGTMVWIMTILEYWLREHAPTYRVEHT